MLPSGELVGGHEDVGRHVALDKLLGRRSQEGESWQQGAVLVSSRASYEMVQKVGDVRRRDFCLRCLPRPRLL